MNKHRLAIIGICCLLALGPSLTRCKKDDPVIIHKNLCEAIDSSTVYAAGTETRKDKTGHATNYAVYWKNGHEVILTDSATNALGHAIAVSGNDVYVAGVIPPHAKYWKNGVVVSLSESISTALAIAISGSDLYIVGNVFEDDRIQAVYWKNDIRVDLSDGVHECKASSIAVVGNDVYVSGTLNLNGISVARYWKNGVPVDLTDTTTVVATASSIFVSGTDVYVAGQQALIQGNTLKVSTAIYWKNGSPVLLSNGIHDARALSIYVSENQVHVVGYEQYFDINNSIAKYWIDGYELTVSGNTGKYISFAKATSIVVAGGNIYAAVQEGDPANNTSFAKYWRDGCTINLTEGSSITDINSMFVVE